MIGAGQVNVGFEHFKSCHDIRILPDESAEPPTPAAVEMVANTLRDEEVGGGLCGGGHFFDFNNGADIIAGGTRAFFDDVPGWRINLADSSTNATDIDSCLSRCNAMDSCKHISFTEQCQTANVPGGCCFL